MFVYLVTAGSKMGTTFNKRVALRAAKSLGGQVYRMGRGLYRDGLSGMFGFWDRPTFILQAEKMYG